MRLFKKKSPSAQEAAPPVLPPEAATAAEEPQVAAKPAEKEEMKSSRFSFRRPDSPTADETTPPDGYATMNEKSVELPQKHSEEQGGENKQQSEEEDDDDVESLAVEVTKVELTWMGFVCLWIWCAVPCVVYLLLFTVSHIRSIASCLTAL
jgi:hypothetical protein